MFPVHIIVIVKEKKRNDKDGERPKAGGLWLMLPQQPPSSFSDGGSTDLSNYINELAAGLW